MENRKRPGEDENEPRESKAVARDCPSVSGTNSVENRKCLREDEDDPRESKVVARDRPSVSGISRNEQNRREVINEEVKCYICFDTETLQKKLHRLSCEHIFHSSCIKRWLERGWNDNWNSTCPMCRRSPSIQDLYALQLLVGEVYCSICKRTETKYSELYRAPCKCIFHLRCIKLWLEQRLGTRIGCVCPACNRSLSFQILSTLQLSVVCTICQRTETTYTGLYSLSCQHIFHSSCIKHVLEQKSKFAWLRSCPLCFKIPTIQNLTDLQLRVSCFICKETATMSPEFYILSCRHIFHKSCIKRPLKENMESGNEYSCPVCQFRLSYWDDKNLELPYNRHGNNRCSIH